MRVIKEGQNKTVVLAWGRFNPVTRGHKLLFDTTKAKAAEVGGTPILYISHKQDPKSDPLTYEQKVKYIKAAGYGDILVESPLKALPLILSELNEEFENLILYCGSDQYGDYSKLVYNYNGKPSKSGTIPFNFDTVKVEVAGGDRDEGSGGTSVEEAKASWMRKFAAENNYERFAQMAIPMPEEYTKQMFDDVRAGMGITDDDITEDYLKEDQTDIIGSMTIDTNDGSNTYSVYTSTGNQKEAIMGDERHYSDWSDRDINSVTLNLNDLKCTSDDVTVANSGGHVKFEIETPQNKVVRITGKKGSGRSGGSSFTDKDITSYQEVIMGLLLKGITVPNDDVETYLRESVVESDGHYVSQNIFSFGLKGFVDSPEYFAKWNSFVKLWWRKLQVVYNTKSVFYGTIADIGWTYNDIKNSVMLHLKYGDGTFIFKQDIYDKSDIYYCLDNSVVSELNSLTNDVVEYCKKVEEYTLNKKILGVSLKRPSGSSIVCEYDIPGFNLMSFDDDPFVEYHFTAGGNARTVNLRFKGVTLTGPDNYPVLEVRSDGATKDTVGKAKFAVQWKFNKATGAWAGKGKVVFGYLFGEEAYNQLKDAAKEQNFIKCANIILRYLKINVPIDYQPSPDEHIQIDNEDTEVILTKFMNLSMGFNGRDENNNRITAPYVKVF